MSKILSIGIVHAKLVKCSIVFKSFVINIVETKVFKCNNSAYKSCRLQYGIQKSYAFIATFHTKATDCKSCHLQQCIQKWSFAICASKSSFANFYFFKYSEKRRKKLQ